MSNTNNDNDIDALLKYLSRAAEDPHTKTPIGITAAGFYSALTALVAERDKAKLDFSEAWRERSEFAKRIDEADAALAAALQALRKAHDAMVLAKTSHGCILACDPPLDAWKYRCVDAHLGDAIRECAAAMRKENKNA